MRYYADLTPMKSVTLHAAHRTHGFIASVNNDCSVKWRIRPNMVGLPSLASSRCRWTLRRACGGWIAVLSNLGDLFSVVALGEVRWRGTGVANHITVRFDG